MKKILIGDDHAVVRKGLRAILEEAFPFAEIHEAIEGASLLKMAIKNEYDIIVSDLSMPGRSGIEVIKELKSIQSKTPVIILSMHPANQYAVRAIKAGASGYINKESAGDELVRAINHIKTGRKYITAEVAEILANHHDHSSYENPHQALSNREFEVLKLLANGSQVSEIATQLSLSINSISTYKKRILEKLQLKSTADIARYALENNLI